MNAATRMFMSPQSVVLIAALLFALVVGFINPNFLSLATVIDPTSNPSTISVRRSGTRFPCIENDSLKNGDSIEPVFPPLPHLHREWADRIFQFLCENCAPGIYRMRGVRRGWL